MVPDEKSNAMQVGAAPAGSPTLLPNVESQHSEWGCLRYRSCKQLASTAWRFRPARSVAMRPFAARLFLGTPMRRHAHAASDRGTNRIA